MQGLYDKHAGMRYTYGDPRDQAEEKKGDRVVGGALPIHPDAEMKRVVGVAMRNASVKQQAARAELGGTPARAAGKVLGAARGVVGRGIRAGAPVPAAELQRVASLLPADSPQNTPIPTLSCEERVECAYHLIDLWSMGGCFVSRNSPVLPLLSSMLGLDVEAAWKKDANLPQGYLSASQLPGNTISVVCTEGPKSQAVQDLLAHLLHDLWSGYMSEIQLAPAAALILQILATENAVDPVSTAETAELEEKGLVEVPMGKMVLTKLGCVYAAALSWRAYDALMMRYPL